MNTQINNISKEFLIDDVLRDYSSNSKDTELLNQIAVLKNEKIDSPVIWVGAGTCGLGAGAGKTIIAVKKYLDENNIEARLIETGCIGLCAVEPIMDVQIPGYKRISLKHITEDKVNSVLDSLMSLETPNNELVLLQFDTPDTKAWEGVKYYNEHPFFAPQQRFVLQNCGIINPVNINEYIARGGYKSYIKAININSPEDVCDTIEKSGLRGRGGGGFPTGRKWKFANSEKADQKYLICNADEGDPGAFMDRAVIEGDPHRLIEGMALGAYAIGATKAYIYIRAEYPLAIERLQIAIKQAKEYGLVGEDIFGTGVDFDIKIKKGAGAFVCGEETALMHSIEGKRGMPRPRPPFPTTSGLFGKPTVINNVETFANVPSIVDKGADWFASTGTENSKGTKVFALSGKIALTGLVEIPMGTTVRQILFDIAGGIMNNKKFKAVQIGGPSGGCITEENLDIQIDYESLVEVGAMMGSGGLVVMDEETCMVDVAKFFMGFIQMESCGKCIPCREGTKRLLEILEDITSKPQNTDNNEALDRFKGVMQIEKLCDVIKDSSLCGLGQTAPNPVLSTLKWFKKEYEAHVFDRHCPAGVCQNLKIYKIDVDKCTGCTVCIKKCPVDAIIGNRKAPHFIVEDKCIGCGACFEACKFEAIQVV
jgi:NADH:ubiquinone oxidoreductase subunit F (NADH-binding)/(2Fe-2S) ferredoxin